MASEHVDTVVQAYVQAGVPCTDVGRSVSEDSVKLAVQGVQVVGGRMTHWRDVWEATSFQLERRQASS